MMDKLTGELLESLEALLTGDAVPWCSECLIFWCNDIEGCESGCCHDLVHLKQEKEGLLEDLQGVLKKHMGDAERGQ
jgi:hypothetical protein